MYKVATPSLLQALLFCTIITVPVWTHAAESRGIELFEKRGADGPRFWAYQPPKKVSPPPTRNQHWPRHDIDRFILAKLEAKDIKPMADADKRTLARRAYYDLIGLPPSPEEMDEFANDLAPDVFARFVDRLLALPQFGERWGRHWLDVARFGESVTLRGFVFKEAWRYRDYVIDAFNNDLPYDRFIQEQIAGDLMPSSTLEERRRRIIATAFLTLGNTNLEEQDKAQLRMDVVDEQLDTIGKAFLGQTIGCARCHDHKFDPIPTRDYYALAGILRSTKTLIHANVSNWIELPLPVSQEQEEIFKSHETAVNALQAELKSAKESVANSNQGTKGHVIADAVQFIPSELPEDPPVSVAADKGSPNRSDTAEKLAETKKASDEVKRLEAALKKLVESGPPRPMVMSVKEEEEIGDTQIHIRGSVHSLGQKVRRGFLQAATPDAPPIVPEKESGRRELGEWLSSPSNPLTARVMVNRVWHWLYGAGLVRTTDNFGAMGETPSHPELLDYLAIRFIEEGWSVKKLIRQLMLTHTYQLGSGSAPEQAASVQDGGNAPPGSDESFVAADVRWLTFDSRNNRASSRRLLRNDVEGSPLFADSENRLLWRMNRRRLDAECIRDTILLVSGQLKFDRGGSAIRAEISADYGYQYSDTRRSVYAPVLRNALPELYEVFDFADPSMVAGCRNFSTGAPQALFLLNHPFMLEQAQYAAKRLLAESALNERASIERAYRLALGRLPTEGELRVVTKHLIDGMGDQSGTKLVEVWSQLFQSLFASVDFRYLD